MVLLIGISVQNPVVQLLPWGFVGAQNSSSISRKIIRLMVQKTRQTHHLRYLKHLKTLYIDVIITFIHHIQQHHLNWLAGFRRISDHIPRPLRCADALIPGDSYQGLATMNVSCEKSKKKQVKKTSIKFEAIILLSPFFE